MLEAGNAFQVRDVQRADLLLAVDNVIGIHEFFLWLIGWLEKKLG
jgi:hypothetical protein